MKVGLFWDEAININSYYVENSTGHRFLDNKPYTYHHSVSPQCYPSTHNFTFLWGDGVFLHFEIMGFQCFTFVTFPYFPM